MNKLEKQREYRRQTGNAATLKYEKSESGFIMRMYRNMKSRVTGIQKKKYHLYKNKYLLPKEDFYDFMFLNDQFKLLFKEWVASGYDQKVTPSINRIDPSKGYEIGNIEISTNSENSRLGAMK